MVLIGASDRSEEILHTFGHCNLTSFQSLLVSVQERRELRVRLNILVCLDPKAADSVREPWAGGGLVLIF